MSNFHIVEVEFENIIVYLKSAPSNLSKSNISRKNKND